MTISVLRQRRHRHDSRRRFGVEIHPRLPRARIIGTNQFAHPETKVLAVFHPDAVFFAELVLEESMH